MKSKSHKLLYFLLLLCCLVSCSSTANLTQEEIHEIYQKDMTDYQNRVVDIFELEPSSEEEYLEILKEIVSEYRKVSTFQPPDDLATLHKKFALEIEMACNYLGEMVSLFDDMVSGRITEDEFEDKANSLPPMADITMTDEEVDLLFSSIDLEFLGW